MDIYERIGIKPLINCATTYTRLGGSIMDRDVAQAMADASGCFVNIFDLHEAVGRRLAEITGNEAAYVTNGAAAGLALATAAAITGDDPSLMARLPNNLDGMKNEVIVHRTQRNWYDVAVRQTGVTLVEIGHILETFPWELDAAMNERTAAVLYFAGSHLNRNTLPLDFVVERAHSRGIPVIVDAAAQTPPTDNLWRFTREFGADVVLFSGGKMLRGPQNSGMAVGSESMIRAMRFNGPPHQRIGRSMKVSKEAMIALLLAVERYLTTDHDAEAQEWDRVVTAWLWDWTPHTPPQVQIERLEINEAGEPIPRIIVRFHPGAKFDRNAFVTLLRHGEPGIEVVLHDESSVAFSPHLLQTGEAVRVTDRITELFSAMGTDVPPTAESLTQSSLLA